MLDSSRFRQTLICLSVVVNDHLYIFFCKLFKYFAYFFVLGCLFTYYSFIGFLHIFFIQVLCSIYYLSINNLSIHPSNYLSINYPSIICLPINILSSLCLEYPFLVNSFHFLLKKWNNLTTVRSQRYSLTFSSRYSPDVRIYNPS